MFDKSHCKSIESCMDLFYSCLQCDMDKPSDFETLKYISMRRQISFRPDDHGHSEIPAQRFHLPGYHDARANNFSIASTTVVR